MRRVTGWLTGLTVCTLMTSLATAGPATAAPVAADAGTIVAERPIGPGSAVPGAADSRTVTYRTTGAEGLANAMIFEPEGTPPQGGWPIVAWAHGTVGMADQDAPSNTGVNYQLYRDLFSDWLRRGFLVVATDYAGLGTPGVHPYLDADVAAHNVVDSVRAARSLHPEASDVWAVAGQSQGGHAALATAVRAETLSPELDFRGTFASGAPTNLDRLAALAGPDFPDLHLDGLTLYMVYVAAGLRQSRPDVDVDSYLTPLGRELVDAADTTPLDVFRPSVASVPLGSLFTRPLAGTPIPQALTDYLGVPTTGFDEPVMLVQGLADHVVPPPLTLWYSAELALSGEPPELLLPAGGHISSLEQSVPEIGAFLERILAP
ncbi:lipase family protein [Rhodococcus sp. NPDC003318]|uniref:lipase family protein n=1 Tax=Rhodococcus sp. NPDC003318 TaxID=3364503 RepID=UPI00369C372D